MKQTIEHLAPYLPYGLKILRPDGKTKLTMVGIDGNHYVFEGTTYGTIGSTLNKPLLRSLSDLTKEIEHNGERFVPIERIKTEWLIDFEYIDQFGVTSIKTPTKTILIAINGEIVDECPLGFYKHLLSWHFDIFGLIPQGLAIPIKPIDNEQD